MKDPFKRKRMARAPRLLISRFLRSWPFWVWLAVAGLVFGLYEGKDRFQGMSGAVDTISENIAPLITSRIKAIHVGLGSRVKTGDPVLELDPALDPQLAADEAAIQEAEELVQRYQRDTLQLVARAERDIRTAEAVLQETRASQDSDQAEAAALRIELTRREDLLKQHLISERDLGTLRPDLAALERTVAGYPALLAIHERQLADARQNLAETRALLGLGDTARPGATRTAAQTSLLDTLRQRRVVQQNLSRLCATRDGIVSRIDYLPGDVVSGGLPVVRIVSEQTTHIIGFLPEGIVATLTVGQAAIAQRLNGHGLFVPIKLESIAPEVRALPTRASPVAGQVLRGRRVVFRIDGRHDLSPGETVKIRDVRSSWLSRWLADVTHWHRSAGSGEP